MIVYKTVAGEASAEQTIEKSKFIAYVSPAYSREEAEKFIAEIKAKHKDATHNVPAMVIGERKELQWASDDGEPGGTSGTPILQLITGSDLTNVCVVVTRYFGGIKLGTGGLVRAYTSSARMALELAGVREVKEMFHMEIETGYQHLKALENMAKKSGFEIGNPKYSEVVNLTLCCESEREQEMKNKVNEVTSGRSKIVSETVKTT